MKDNLRQEKLQFWAENNFNVLLIGRHGVGKSTRVINIWNEMKLKWRYFSAATMDPWVDFIGVPKTEEDSSGEFLKLVLPKEFRDDNIEAIFMDEFNRAHPKVQNAVMELLQFKSINGRKFNNLRMVWAAINPPETEDNYSVEKIDPAIMDRFHVQVTMPWEPSREWFSEKFGKLGVAIISWWEELPADIKKTISPRRLEYALQMHLTENGDIRDVLPHNSNVSKLIQVFKSGPMIDTLLRIYKDKSIKEAENLLIVENTYDSAIKYILDGKKYIKTSEEDWLAFWLVRISKEKLVALMTKNNKILNFVANNSYQEPFKSIVESFIISDGNKDLAKKISHIKENNIYGLFKIINNISRHPVNSYFNKNSTIDWTILISSLSKINYRTNTAKRLKAYEAIAENIPDTLTFTNALSTIEILNKIAERSHPSTLASDRDMPNLIGIINHCLKQIDANKNCSWKSLLDTYGKNFKILFSKLFKNGQLINKLWIPNQL